MQALAEPLLADADEVLARERREAAGFGIGPGKDDLQQPRLLVRLELGRAALARTVGEPVEAVLIGADDPVAQSLAVHPRRHRRGLTAHPVARVGNRQHAPSHASGGITATIRGLPVVCFA